MTSRKEVESIKTIRIKQSDLNSLITPDGNYELRYRIVAEDGTALSNWTETISLAAPIITQTNTNLKISDLTGNDFSLSFLKKYEFPAYDIFVYFVPVMDFSTTPFINTIRQRSNNTAAIYFTPVPHFLKPNMRVAVTGVGTNYNTSNALVVASNATSFTITGGMTSTTAANSTTTSGVITVLSSNVGNVTVSNSEYHFFDRFYDRPGSTTFFTNFNITNIYAVKTTANVVTDLIFDPQQSTANLLSNLSATGQVVKYTASNNCIFIAMQPATVSQDENKKPDIITSPNLILAKQQIP